MLKSQNFTGRPPYINQQYQDKMGTPPNAERERPKSPELQPETAFDSQKMNHFAVTDKHDRLTTEACKPQEPCLAKQQKFSTSQSEAIDNEQFVTNPINKGLRGPNAFLKRRRESQHKSETSAGEKDNIGCGRFHVVRESCEKINGNACVTKYPLMNNGPDSAPKKQSKFNTSQIQTMELRGKHLYDLALLAGIPCAETEFKLFQESGNLKQANDMSTVQVRCKKISTNEAEAFLDFFIDKLATLWSLDIFVLFDFKPDNCMQHPDTRIVMIDFGGERSSSDFESGDDFGLVIHSILQNDWQCLSEDKRQIILRKLITGLAKPAGKVADLQRSKMQELYQSTIRNSYGKDVDNALSDTKTYRAALIKKLEWYLSQSNIVFAVPHDRIGTMP